MAYVLAAKWVAKEGEEDNVLAALEQLAGPSRAEPGCLMWQPHRDPENPGVFFFYEQYADAAAFEAHGASEHFQRLGVGDAIPRLESRERTFYETVDL
ncbi:MAG: putative quinol monooxygenase [Gaiellaceae bacterium]|jgi:quinol monooxygenase YgiN